MWARINSRCAVAEKERQVRTRRREGEEKAEFARTWHNHCTIEGGGMARPLGGKIAEKSDFFSGGGTGTGAQRVEVCGVLRSDTVLLGLTWVQMPVN
jgi:hypothetical protein